MYHTRHVCGCAARGAAPPPFARLAQKKGFPLMPMSSTSNSRVAPGGMSGGAPRWPSAVQDNDKRYLGAGGWAECTAGRAWFDVLARTCEVGRACESRLLALAHLQHALVPSPDDVSGTDLELERLLEEAARGVEDGAIQQPAGVVRLHHLARLRIRLPIAGLGRLDRDAHERRSRRPRRDSRRGGWRDQPHGRRDQRAGGDEEGEHAECRKRCRRGARNFEGNNQRTMHGCGLSTLLCPHSVCPQWEKSNQHVPRCREIARNPRRIAARHPACRGYLRSW